MAAGTALTRAPRPSSLADVLDLILDKGLVIDAYVRVSLVGIEILTVDARIVIASVDTYLHFAEAVNRLDLRPTETEGIPGFLNSQSNSDDEDESNDGDSNDGDRDRSSRRGSRQALARGGGTRGSSRRADGDQSSGLVKRLADRGKWEDE